MKSNLPIDEAIYEEGYNQAIKDLDNFDWSAFRREAAKDILSNIAGQLTNDDTAATIDDFDPKFYAKVAIEWADELIKQLQETEEIH